jgi:hypothetical protein
MQRAVITILEEEIFSVWFAYIHSEATDVFSTGPQRGDYVSSRKSEVSRRTGTRLERGLRSQGRRFRLKIDLELL